MATVKKPAVKAKPVVLEVKAAKPAAKKTVKPVVKAVTRTTKDLARKEPKIEKAVKAPVKKTTLIKVSTKPVVLEVKEAKPTVKTQPVIADKTPAKVSVPVVVRPPVGQKISFADAVRLANLG